MEGWECSWRTKKPGLQLKKRFEYMAECDGHSDDIQYNIVNIQVYFMEDMDRENIEYIIEYIL